MPKIKQTLERVAIDSIKPHPKNPNKGDVDFIGESIDVNGWYGTITIQKSTRRILAGEHRWRAAKKQGLEFVDVAVRDCTDVEALRILLVDNESARRGIIQRDDLMDVLKTIGRLSKGDLEGGLKGTGYEPEDLEAWIEEQEQQDQAGDDEEGDPDDWNEDGVGMRYGILVMVDDEAEQKAMFEKLQASGVPPTKMRVVAV